MVPSRRWRGNQNQRYVGLDAVFLDAHVPGQQSFGGDLGDRLMGTGPFVQQFPGGERALTLAEIQEVQQKLTAAGFDTKGTDGRVGPATMVAGRDFQRKAGISPADGYPGLKVLARLRQGL